MISAVYGAVVSATFGAVVQINRALALITLYCFYWKGKKAMNNISKRIERLETVMEVNRNPQMITWHLASGETVTFTRSINPAKDIVAACKEMENAGR